MKTFYAGISPITTETRTRGVEYFCGCQRWSLQKNLFGKPKRIHLILLPEKCPEHRLHIKYYFDKKN